MSRTDHHGMTPYVPKRTLPRDGWARDLRRGRADSLLSSQPLAARRTR